MSRESSLAKNAVIFAIGNFGSKLLVLLILPFCTYYIEPSGMGTYDLIYTLVEALKPIAVLAVPESLFRWMLDKGSNIKLVLSSWTRMALVIFGAFTVIYGCIWYFVRFQDALMLYLLIASGVVYLGMQFATRGLHNNALFALQGIVYSVALCASSLLSVIVFDLDYQGLLLGIIIGNITASAIMIIFQRGELRFDFGKRSSTMQREMFRYSAMLLPNSISWWVVNGFGRIIVTVCLGVAANGVFAIASRFPMALNMIATIFQQAWTEQAIGEYDSADRNAYFSSIFKTYSRLMVSATLLLIPCTKLFIDFFLDPTYHEASNYIGLLYLSSALCAFSSFFGTGYLCGKDTKGAASTSIFGAVANCLLSILLVGQFGMFGVAGGMAFSQGLIWALRIRHSSMYFSIKIDWPWIIGGLSLCAILSVLMPLASDLFTILLALCMTSVFFFGNRSLITNGLKMLKGIVQAKRSGK